MTFSGQGSGSDDHTAAEIQELPTLAEAIDLMREACQGWPQPNPYDFAMDVIEAKLTLLKKQRGACLDWHY